VPDNIKRKISYMENMERQLIIKGASLSIPPAFLGEDFPYWKNRMKISIKFTDYQLCQIIPKMDVKITSP